ncbi:MAG: DNA damage-inducible protein D [Ruminococcus sp.]|nr:DNA damage-inducible protein D [Ruminococcus sp.]
MNELEKYGEKVFDDIKHFDEEGNEYWLARELMPILQYSNWQNFEKIINKAIIGCENSSFDVSDHFIDISKMVPIGSGAYRKQKDYKLSRYACYLITQNGDSRKSVIALGKTYFAIQTRKQEISEIEYNSLTEEEKRFYQRNLTKKGNCSLNQAAKNAGVKNFDKFHNFGYKGLYNGETADDIAKRKGLRYREDILDNMGSEELAANLFRITQTKAKLKREHIEGEGNANIAHNKVGKIVRNAIKEAGGTMPENLPTPAKSLKQIEKERLIKQ